ncbi:MAG: protein kinase [Myxococcota bacterium]
MERSQFGRYVLEERLAVGGMAELFLASMAGPGGFKKSVVVKRLNAKLAQRDQTVAMFLREARLAGRFKHHNLIQVYELFDVDGQYALAMEHLEGVDLGQVLARSVQSKVTIPDAVVARIIAGAAAGLHAAHELRDDDWRSLAVVHRDVSPTNVFVTWQGVVKVVDFGIATARDELELTRAGVLKGKIGYMAPEQARGMTVDRRTDVYALGIVLYELVTRRRCYAGEDQLELLNRVREGKHTPLTALRPDCDPDLARLCEQMLSVAVDARPESCDAVRREAGRIASVLGSTGDDDVAAMARGLFPDARPSDLRRPPTAMRDILLGERTPTPASKSTRTVVVGAALMAAVLIVVGIAAWYEPEAEIPTADTRIAEKPIAEKPIAEKPIVEKPIADRPIADGPIADGPMADEPMADKPIADKPIAAKPIADPVKPPAVGTRPPPPRRPDVDRTARLFLSSVPDANVSVNGTPLGRTPITDKRIDAGRWTIRLRDEKSSFDTTVRLNTKPGDSVRKELVFRTGHVVVDAQPWADVYLGGKKLGSTPLPPTQLYEGVYSLRLVNPELHSERIVSVTVSPGRTSKVTEVLK